MSVNIHPGFTRCFVYAILWTIPALFSTACSMDNPMPEAEEFFTTPQSLELAGAIERGDVETIRELAKTLDINARGNRGMTYLMWSIAHLQMESYQTLLDLGADDEMAVEGITVMGVAMDQGVEWLQPLLATGADINQKHREKPVWFRSFMGLNWKAFDYFLDNGVDIDAQDGVGYTAAMLLAGFADYDRVLKLLNLGADVHLRTRNGNSLAYEVQESIPSESSEQYQYREEVIKILKSKGITFPVLGPRELKAQQQKS